MLLRDLDAMELGGGGGENSILKKQLKGSVPKDTRY